MISYRYWMLGDFVPSNSSFIENDKLMVLDPPTTGNLASDSGFSQNYYQPNYRPNDYYDYYYYYLPTELQTSAASLQRKSKSRSKSKSKRSQGRRRM